MKVEICIGSSCHLRGSREIIEVFDRLAKQNRIDKKMDLCGSFCMGACSKGVSVRIDEDAIYHVKPEDAEAFFREEILGRFSG